ncbi:MAG: hypothetical protein QM755_22670 [Luteolibacter sp.]
MKRTLPAKIAAVCSSLILGCTYVSSQNSSHKETPASRTTPPSSRNVTPSTSPQTTPPAVTIKQRTVLPSSKSIDSILSPPAASQDDIQPPAEPATKTVMPSSKSAPIFKEGMKDPFKTE